ncbi:MAG: hypothetical protein JRM74_05715 [Nitrososphaerota archaeon]|nr:hypothetical protein [Nitrososphaerota archaeon]
MKSKKKSDKADSEKLATSLYVYKATESDMSTTIRVSKRDKEALEGLQRRLGTKTMSETLRRAIALAKASDDRFLGNLEALQKVLSAARPSARGTARAPERVDEETAEALAAESA